VQPILSVVVKRDLKFKRNVRFIELKKMKIVVFFKWENGFGTPIRLRTLFNHTIFIVITI
jgi:hypothetical protein